MGSIIAAVILLICVLIGGIAGNYFYNLALDPKTDKSAVFNAPHNNIESEDAEAAEEEAVMETSASPEALRIWSDTITYTQHRITSFDDLKLSGHVIYQETPTHQWVIVAHGYGMRGIYMAASAKHFYEQGYNVLLPDARGHGDSEGNYIGMGWHDRLDMAAWIEEVITWDPESRIVLYGVSMGGATVMMTAGEELPPNVKAVVEDCGYTSVGDEFAYQLKELFGLPRFPVIQFASAVTKIRAGYTFGEASALQQLKKAEIPILFIHGEDDTFVPYEMLDQVYAAAAGEKERFIVAGAGHGEASNVAGEAYWSKVFGFIDNYIE